MPEQHNHFDEDPYIVIQSDGNERAQTDGDHSAFPLDDDYDPTDADSADTGEFHNHATGTINNL